MDRGLERQVSPKTISIYAMLSRSRTFPLDWSNIQVERWDVIPVSLSAFSSSEWDEIDPSEREDLHLQMEDGEFW